MVGLADPADMAWRCWQDEVVVYHLRTSAVHHLDGLAAAVFTELADGGPRSRSALEDWLAEAAAVPVAEARGPLAASLESLSRCQLIVQTPHA